MISRFGPTSTILVRLTILSVSALFLICVDQARADVIAAGSTHTCAINSDRGVECWGRGEQGQLGNGAQSNSSTPVQVSGITIGATHVASGNGFSCAIVGGAAKCWGRGDEGQLGDGNQSSSSTPVDVSELGSGVTAISATADHACAIVNGAAKCWGENAAGQLGNGISGSGLESPEPVDVVGLSGEVTAISTGASASCAVVSAGVKCWGANLSGELGDGNRPTASVNPVDVVGLSSGVVSISSGRNHTCALLESGAVKCWGAGAYGQLGNDASTFQPVPVDVVGLAAGVTEVSSGHYHTCAVVDGGAKCWGSGSSGQIGDGLTADRDVPTAVPGVDSGVTAISAGDSAPTMGHTCAVVAGEAKCWGSNAYGQLGDAADPNSTSPVDVDGLSSGVTSISAGDNHSCAVVSAAAKCWGSNETQQLGISGGSSRGPVDVTGLSSGVTAISAGGLSSCAIVSGGVKCWGSNFYGQLGNGSTTTSFTPVDVVGLGSGSGAIAISVGRFHACAVLDTGAAKCWGSNGYGQLGNDDPPNGSSSPVDVTGLSSGVSQIGAGAAHTCAIVSGAARCWGSNYSGEAGDGSADGIKPTSVEVSGMSANVTKLAVGASHSCAVVSATLKCWGLNLAGQLGDGTTATAGTPQAVAGNPSAIGYLAAGEQHSCATASGALRCWGINDEGELGDGSITSSLTAIPVVGFSSGTSGISAGQKHTCAFNADGAAKCWGHRFSGQIGDGVSDQETDPVAVVGFTPVDTTTPTISGVSPVNGTTTAADSIVVTFTVGDDLDPSPVCTPTSGSSIPLVLGANVITISCTDAGGNVASQTTSVTRTAVPAALPAPPTPAEDVPVAKTVSPKLTRYRKAKVKGKYVYFGAQLKFAVPSGAKSSSACSGKITGTTKPKSLKRTAKASGKLKTTGKSCVAILKFKLTKKFRNKKVKVKVTFRGNSFVKKINKTIQHTVK